MGLPSSTYRVAVRHRNQLGIMTSAAYDLLINAAMLAKGSYLVEVRYGRGLVQHLRWTKQ